MMKRVFLPSLALCLTFFLPPVATVEETEVRLVLFTCVGPYYGTYSFSSVWLKPAFDLAMKTVGQRLESGLYKGHHFNVNFLGTCSYDVAGISAELHFRQPFDVIMGPPTSPYSL